MKYHDSLPERLKKVYDEWKSKGFPKMTDYDPYSEKS